MARTMDSRSDRKRAVEQDKLQQLGSILQDVPVPWHRTARLADAERSTQVVDVFFNITLEARPQDAPPLLATVQSSSLEKVGRPAPLQVMVKHELIVVGESRTVHEECLICVVGNRRLKPTPSFWYNRRA